MQDLLMLVYADDMAKNTHQAKNRRAEPSMDAAVEPRAAGVRCTFPDGSSFPTTSVKEAGEESTLVFYLLDGTPQMLWVPRDFVER